MENMVLLLDDGPMAPWPEMSPEEQVALLQKHEAFGTACAAHDGVRIVSEAALAGPESATVMRTDQAGSTMLTEGPYAEAIEGLGGFYLIETPDLDVLVDLLKILPPYTIEIRPSVQY